MARRQSKNTFVRVGLPFVIFVVGGFAGLQHFVGGKFEKRDMLVKSQNEHAFNLDEEHRKMMQKIKVDDFEIKRIPNPGEDPRNV
ncbi:hypothetical protein THRCLA_23394 [Thraustotheca clavata]|uniref:Cytochrome c oxidase assembly protein COX16 homolog, mitochondrial n=1 Tax=Thraustotheca clavata TaxID=74557 RepID=A0A1V9Y6L2_9STRA|nr:hypothetical protein THRCLA_23394 [Thraustotheca clavata]